MINMAASSSWAKLSFEVNKQQICKRRILKRVEKICRRNITFCMSCQKASTSVEVKVDFPKRIERSNVDILKALSSTVGKDYTAPHYKFHDDPFFIPTNNLTKAKYEASKEFGRKAARYVKENESKYFARNDASPNIPQFNPEIKENSLESLMINVMNGSVTEATSIYNALKADGQEIPDDIEMNFLELLCFYNSSDPEEEELFSKSKWTRRIGPSSTSAWKSGGLAQLIFNKLESKIPEAYSAYIKGMSKFSSYDGAYELFKSMKEKELKIDLETYNALIPVVALNEGQKSWNNILDLLNQMNKDGIKPNIDTFNTLFEVVTENNFKSSQTICLSILAEMKRLGIEPSLASYYFILACFYREGFSAMSSGAAHTIVYSIMDELEGKTFKFMHPRDSMFFTKVMDVCATKLNDFDLALRVDNLMSLGRNRDLLGPSLNIIAYYSRFFKILCTEDIHTLFEYYNKLVPNTYVPEKTVFKAILESIDLNCAYQYVGQIWTDVVTCRQEKNSVIIETLLSVMSKPLKDDEQVSSQFSEIAKDIMEKVNVKERRTGRSLELNGSMFTNFINIHLNVSKFGDAWKIFQTFQDREYKVTGFISADCVTRLVEECIAKEDQKKAMILVRYGLEVHGDEAKSFTTKVFEHFQVDEAERKALESLLKMTVKEEEAPSSPGYN